MHGTDILCLGNMFEISSYQMYLPPGPATSIDSETRIFGFYCTCTVHTQSCPLSKPVSKVFFFPWIMADSTHTYICLRILNWNRTSIMQRFQSEHQHNLHTPRAVLNSVGNTIALKIAAIWLFSAKTSMLHLQLRNVKTTAKKKAKIQQQQKNQTQIKKIRPV